MTIKFIKKDITPILPRKKGEVIFNPAIVHWKNDLFLCAYRVYIRYKGLDTSKYKDDPYNNPNHPWLGGEQSTVWWRAVSGYDQTNIVLLKINGNKVRFVYSFGMIEGIDIRLFKLKDNTFLVTGNVWLNNEEIKIKSGDCSNGCMLMTVRTLTILKNDIQLTKGKLLCPQHAEKIEKNWTLWKDNDSLFISYGVVPHHEVFHLEMVEGEVECPLVKSIVGEGTLLESLRDYYNGIGSISLSTPALQLSSGNYVAFGHFKYKHSMIDKIGKDTNLYKFHELLLQKNKKFHPLYVYLIYIYEFSSIEPYNILRVSNMFIPDTSNFALAFATNLTFFPKDNKYILSYGEHDSECWILKMSEEEIEQALVHTTDPEKIEFLLI